MSPCDASLTYVIVVSLILLTMVSVPVVMVTGVWRLLGKRRKYQTKQAEAVWLGRESQSGCRILLWDGDTIADEFYGWNYLVDILDGEGEEWAKAKLEEQKARKGLGEWV